MAKRGNNIKKIIVKISSDQNSEGQEKKTFLSILKPTWPKHHNMDFSIKQLRKVLSNEKARILYMLKSKKRAKKIRSVYALAKALDRDFKAVRQDLKLLEQFGFVRLIPEEDKNGKKRLKPVLAVKKFQIDIEL